MSTHSLEADSFILYNQNQKSLTESVILFQKVFYLLSCHCEWKGHMVSLLLLSYAFVCKVKLHPCKGKLM